MDEITKIWPKWKVAGVLGKGAFGNVYKVQKQDFGMEYYAAVKVIHVPQDESEVMELQNTGMDALSIRLYYEDVLKGLINEIQIMEQLKTAGNIVSIEDYMLVEDEGTLGWALYIRMELLESLDAYVQKHGSLDVEETVKMGIDICSALDCCEQSHTIHRDIKPGNIFRNPYGAYKLGDFGISKQMEGTQSIRSQKGTRMYMAPEIYRGESYDNTVDIYALGITMYRFMNNGSFPFLPKAPQPIRPGDLEKAVGNLISGKPLDAPVDGDETLAYIVKKACAYRAEERYQSAAEMKGDLLKWQMAKKFQKSAVDRPYQSSTCGQSSPNFEKPSDTEVPASNIIPSNVETPPNDSVPSPGSFDRTQRFQEEETYRAFSFSPSSYSGEADGFPSQKVEAEPFVAPKVEDEPDRNGQSTEKPDTKVLDANVFEEGSIVKFGSYYQDADGKKMPIEWKVIEKKGSICLLLSQYVLDYKYFHNVKQKISWENCFLREWLNGEFLNNSFTAGERDALSIAELENADYKHKSKIADLPRTQDKVFCLSMDETEKYSFTKEEYRAEATEYVLRQMGNLRGKDAFSSWWLRSANRKKGKALVAWPEGFVGFYPSLVNEYHGVRPAIWVDTSKI